MENRYWFRSTQFKMQGTEEELANSGRYGQALAEWLAAEFSKLGYAAEVINEDFGWCVMCARGEFLLWIGCGCVMTEDILSSTLDNPPDENAIVWHVFTVIETPFFMLKSLVKKWFGILDLASPMNKLNLELHAILTANKSISFCPEP